VILCPIGPTFLGTMSGPEGNGEEIIASLPLAALTFNVGAYRVAGLRINQDQLMCCVTANL
jgi:hypothetical protein